MQHSLRESQDRLPVLHVGPACSPSPYSLRCALEWQVEVRDGGGRWLWSWADAESQLLRQRQKQN